MVCTLAADHVYEIGDDFFSSKKRAIHPSTTLLHESHHIVGCISDGFGVRHVRQLEATVDFDVNLETHDSVFCKILVCLRTSGLFRARHIFEEGIEGASFDRLPTED